MADQWKSTDVEQGFKRRDVTVEGKYDIDTFFMRYLSDDFT